jgi:hypothetical protein
MAFTQGRYQPEILRGPYWRPVPLTGITMAGAAVHGSPGGAGARAGRYPRRLDVWRRPARPDGVGTPVSPPNRA